jgi:hypothetical protein
MDFNKNYKKDHQKEKSATMQDMAKLNIKTPAKP